MVCSSVCTSSSFASVCCQQKASRILFVFPKSPKHTYRFFCRRFGRCREVMQTLFFNLKLLVASCLFRFFLLLVHMTVFVSIPLFETQKNENESKRSETKRKTEKKNDEQNLNVERCQRAIVEIYFASMKWKRMTLKCAECTTEILFWNESKTIT